MANWNLLLSLDLQAVSFTQGVSSSSASLVSSSGPRDTSSTELEPDAASRFCLSLLAAVRGQGRMFNSVIVLYNYYIAIHAQMRVHCCAQAASLVQISTQQ